jgi:hypothetical protein
MSAGADEVALRQLWIATDRIFIVGEIPRAARQTMNRPEIHSIYESSATR